MGAWIETYEFQIHYGHYQSLPTWERGLKLVIAAGGHVAEVAPYVGAWIETTRPTPS